MRARADLEAAFAVLERQADEYTATQEAVDAGAVAVGLMPHDGPHGRPHRRRLAIRVALTAGGVAAAVVAAATVVALAPFQGDGPSHERSGGGGDLSLRTLPFSVAPASGLTIINVSTDGDLTVAELVSTSVHVQLAFHSPGSRIRPASGLKHVQVDGSPGFFSDGSGPALVDPNNQPGDDPAPSHQKYGSALVWEYTPGAWALLSAQNMRELSEDVLLRTAAAFHFDRDVGVRVPFTLKRAPAGMHLDNIYADYHLVGDRQPPFPLTDRRSQFDAQYERTPNENTISIAVSTGGLDPTERTGTPATAFGHPAIWSASLHRLTVEFGNGIYLQVREMHNGVHDDVPLTTTLNQLTRIAETATVTPRPDDQSAWFDAQTALP